MAQVIPRVRELVSLLVERGFTPLAVEILRGLDEGVLVPHKGERAAFDLGVDWQEYIREEEQVWRPETPEEQANFVADMIVDQLIVPLQMHKRSTELLSGIMERDVTIGTLNADDEIRYFDHNKAADLTETGRVLVSALREWLNADDDKRES